MIDNLSWEIVLNFINQLGWSKGILTIFFFLAHFWYNKQIKGRLDDRQKEIDRVTKENREYREKFLSILDSKFDQKKLKE